MAVLGGMRAFWGPLIGAAIFVVLQDYISSETANWMSFIGLFFVLVVLFFPRGVLGIIQRRAAREPARGRERRRAISAAWSRSTMSRCPSSRASCAR